MLIILHLAQSVKPKKNNPGASRVIHGSQVLVVQAGHLFLYQCSFVCIGFLASAYDSEDSVFPSPIHSTHLQVLVQDPSPVFVTGTADMLAPPFLNDLVDIGQALAGQANVVLAMLVRHFVYDVVAVYSGFTSHGSLQSLSILL